MKITALLLALLLLAGNLTGCGAESPASPSVETTTTTQERLTTTTTNSTTADTTPATEPTGTLATSTDDEDLETMVWIPQQGKRYHNNPACSDMIDPQQVSLFSAKEGGYTPCKRCYG